MSLGLRRVMWSVMLGETSGDRFDDYSRGALELLSSSTTVNSISPASDDSYLIVFSVGFLTSSFYTMAVAGSSLISSIIDDLTVSCACLFIVDVKVRFASLPV